MFTDPEEERESDQFTTNTTIILHAPNRLNKYVQIERMYIYFTQPTLSLNLSRRGGGGGEVEKNKKLEKQEPILI